VANGINKDIDVIYCEVYPQDATVRCRLIDRRLYIFSAQLVQNTSVCSDNLLLRPHGSSLTSQASRIQPLSLPSIIWRRNATRHMHEQHDYIELWIVIQLIADLRSVRLSRHCSQSHRYLSVSAAAMPSFRRAVDRVAAVAHIWCCIYANFERSLEKKKTTACTCVRVCFCSAQE